MTESHPPFFHPGPQMKTTQYRKLLRKRIHKAREEDGSFPPYEKNKIIGAKYLEKTSGFFCEVCRKFFQDEDEGMIEHCMTLFHYQRLKNARFRTKEEEKKEEEDEEDKEEGKEEEDKTAEEEKEEDKTAEEGKEEEDKTAEDAKEAGNEEEKMEDDLLKDDDENAN